MHYAAVNNPQASPYDLAFDRNGDLLVTDNSSTNSQVIGIYPPDIQTAAVSLTVGDPVHYLGYNQIALSHRNKHLLVAPLGSGFLYEYAYPSGTLQWKVAVPSTYVADIKTSPAPSVGSW